MEDTRQSVSNAEEIDLLKLAKSVWRKRAFILKVATAGAVVGLVVAFSIPREYTTESCHRGSDASDRLDFLLRV